MLIRDGLADPTATLQPVYLEGPSTGGHLAVAATLIQRHTKVDAFDKHGVTPLHLAARVGHLEIARLLLDNRADINRRNYPGRTPLHMAATSGQVTPPGWLDTARRRVRSHRRMVAALRAPRARGPFARDESPRARDRSDLY